MDAMTEMLTRIETKLDVAIGRLDDHEIRLRALEGRGGKRWENLVNDLIKAVSGAALGYWLGRL